MNMSVRAMVHGLCYFGGNTDVVYSDQCAAVIHHLAG